MEYRSDIDDMVKSAKDDFEKGLAEAGELQKKSKFLEARNSALELEKILDRTNDLSNYFKIVSFLINCGYLSDAERICLKVLDKTNECCVLSLALKETALYDLALISGACASHNLALKLASELINLFPDIQYLWNFKIVCMTYEQSQKNNRELTEKWAEKFLTVPHKPRPRAKPFHDRPLKIGYVSADFKLHPVGFFVHGVLPEHDSKRVQVFAYNSAEESENDPLTKIVQSNCIYRDVSKLDDEQLEKQIREDEIDVLVDLSGHTQGTRISCFAREPAPVLVSWLGYWATTGLACMDAVILDRWHAPEGTEEYFTEEIYRLPVARFCYQPLSEYPEERKDLPCFDHGYVTFGSFHNTSKFTTELFDAWAQILKRVDGSHLLFKWKNFHDPVFCERIARSFESRGIERNRLEMRGWSTLNEMFAEISDVDIVLDTFPFSGGITTCNVLWMGVPLVSLRGETVVSRQGYAILSQLDLEDLVGNSIDHYINIAVGLAKNLPLLILLRSTLRARMRASSLLDTKSFTKHLEKAFYDIYEKKLCHNQF